MATFPGERKECEMAQVPMLSDAACFLRQELYVAAPSDLMMTQPSFGVAVNHADSDDRQTEACGWNSVGPRMTHGFLVGSMLPQYATC